MPVITFRCPHCSADLKIRDDQISTAPVPCPDCRKPILITRDEFGNVAASGTKPPGPGASKGQKASAPGKPGAPAAAKTQASPIVREEPAHTTEDGAPLWKRLSQTTLLWIAGSLVAVVVILAAGIWMWPRGSKPEADAKAAVSEAAPAGHPSSPAKGGPSAPAKTASQNQAAGAEQKAPALPTAAGRLLALGQRIVEYRAKRGHLPTAAPGTDALPPSERLSWLAELLATVIQPDRPAPLWNESWRSQRNERFVRQRVPEFLNPSIDKLTGAENYPATHFAGVAGVGADAADLPIGHPRAGIFGNNRTTRMEDIRDGASNTAMVVGVTGELGSWAAAGKPTVRAFTQEPYVNGPDGIGTGSPDRMMVLMADGSVREISAKIDPRIVRRMAAMADGLPLDPKVPGEPGDSSPRAPAPDRATVSTVKPQSVPQGAKPAGGNAKAAEPAAAHPAVVATQPKVKKPGASPAPPPKVDLSKTLAQRVLRFEQIKPVPLRDMLNSLEDLVAAPIRGDRNEIPELDELLLTPVSAQLENTTVAAMLEAVLAPARLTYKVEGDAIHLHRLGPVSGRAAAP